jgi:hypothetical protein
MIYSYVNNGHYCYHFWSKCTYNYKCRTHAQIPSGERLNKKSLIRFTQAINLGPLTQTHTNAQNLRQRGAQKGGTHHGA